MSNCRFHYLSSKQTGKFKFQWLEDEMWPYEDGDSKYVAGFQGGCFRCLGKRLRCGSQSLSITWTTARSTSQFYWTTGKPVFFTQEGNHRNLARNLWIQQRNLLGAWLPPLRPSSKMAKRFRENCKDLVRRVRKKLGYRDRHVRQAEATGFTTEPTSSTSCHM